MAPLTQNRNAIGKLTKFQQQKCGRSENLIVFMTFSVYLQVFFSLGIHHVKLVLYNICSVKLMDIYNNRLFIPKQKIW